MSERWPQIQFTLKAMFAVTALISAGLALILVHPWLIPPVMFGCLFACVGAFLGALRAGLFHNRLDMETLGIWGFAGGGLLGLVFFFALSLVGGLSW